MSQESVEVVRRAYEAWSRGDFMAGMEVFDPDVRIVWLDPLDVQDVETRGLEAASARLAVWLKSWNDVTLTAERIIDAGDRVAVIGAWRARGRGSGVTTEWRHGQVWRLRDGKVVEAITYAEPADALAAAGVSE